MKSKSAIMKEKLTNYIKNEQHQGERHVSSSDRVGKRYRNMASVFSIGDDDEGIWAIFWNLLIIYQASSSGQNIVMIQPFHKDKSNIIGGRG